jgi:hypothetical protein
MTLVLNKTDINQNVNTYQDVLTIEEINYLMNLPEVQKAKENIDKLESNGFVYFSISLTPAIKQKISTVFNIDLYSLDSIPMRWIKGDTEPHVDNSVRDFEKTHLVYLTDSTGQFVIHENTYPITKGTAYIFEEGLNHETIGTGLESRLLMGPMSEKGLAVGAGVSIVGTSGQTAYIKQEGNDIYYSYDDTNWNMIYYWPVLVNNQDETPTSTFNIEFKTDITLTLSSCYFYCYSNYIQFGSRTLKNDGTRPKIIISGVTEYSGLVSNWNGVNGFSNINIFNLEVLSSNSSTIAASTGWICQQYFGADGAVDNYIINCHSNGDTSESSGGIVGSNAASNGGTLNIIGCSSSGEISGLYSGGIVGSNAGGNGGIVNITSSWSTGVISGDSTGGIVGRYSYNASITNCYSSGIISGINAGGIVGGNAGLYSCIITNCYSLGEISGNYAGGITGSINPAVSETCTCNVSNCYSIGNIDGTNDAGGILGLVSGSGGDWSLSITNCYTVGSTSGNKGYIVGGKSGVNFLDGSSPQIITCQPNNYSEADSGTPGSWDDSNTNVLTGTPLTYPGIGTTWVSQGINQPYLLFNMGYTPYSKTNISGTQLIRTASSTITNGQSTGNAIINGLNYSIIQKTGGDSNSYGSININLNSGSITTTSSTIPGVYTIYIYNTGSYNITIYTLTVNKYNPPVVIRMRSLFTNNAQVYYKPHSLAAGGIGTVKNSRHKSRKT